MFELLAEFALIPESKVGIDSKKGIACVRKEKDWHKMRENWKNLGENERWIYNELLDYQTKYTQKQMQSKIKTICFIS